MFKQKYKKLYKYYKKALDKSNKYATEGSTYNLSWFITYLRYIRDYYIVTTNANERTSSKKIKSICYAIHEYELYIGCIENYFILKNNILVPKNAENTYTQAQDLYQAEKQNHWKNFWVTISLYIEDWFNLDEALF